MTVIHPIVPSLAALFTAISLAELEMTPSADNHCGLNSVIYLETLYHPKKVQ